MPDPSRSIDAKSSRYEPLFELASGGMGRVSIARLRGTAGFQRIVALKTIHPFLATEPRFQEMFFDEARLAAGIHHPNVVPVLDLGQLDDTYFLAMEYVPGESLSNVMIACHDARRRIPWAVALRWIADACAGLHAAHELRDPQGRLLNVVHRDISPSNLLVTDHGSCKLTDFGIAKALATRSDTTAGALKGKIGYLSPEQVLNSKPDRRSDIFSLGIILFEVTTLRKLFGNPSHVETLEDIVRGQLPDPRKIIADYPPALADIVRKALARDRTQRYQTAEEMGAALERAARDLPEPMVQSDVTAWTRTHFGALFELRRKKIAVAMEAADRGDAPAPKAAPVETVLIASRVAPDDQVAKAAAQPSLPVSPPTATIVPTQPDRDAPDEVEMRAETYVGIVTPEPDEEIERTNSITATDHGQPRIAPVSAAQKRVTGPNPALPRAPATATNPAFAAAPATEPSVPSVGAIDPGDDFETATTVMPSNETPRSPTAPSAIAIAPLAMGTVPMGQVEPELSLASITVDRTRLLGRAGFSRWAVYGVVVAATFAMTVYLFSRNTPSPAATATPPVTGAPVSPATAPTVAVPVNPSSHPAPPALPPVSSAPSPPALDTPAVTTSTPSSHSSGSRRSGSSTSRTHSHRTTSGTVGSSSGTRPTRTFRPADP